MKHSPFSKEIGHFWTVSASTMVSRLLIGDNNLSRFWPSYQFSRSALKGVQLCTATDLDTFDHGLSQVEDKSVVVISVLTSILLEEVNQLEVESSAANVCEQTLTRLFGVCPGNLGCQVRNDPLFSQLSFIHVVW